MKRKSPVVVAAEAKLGVSLPAEYAAFMAKGGPSGEGTVMTLEGALASETLRMDLGFPFTKAQAKRALVARARGEDVFLEPADSVGGVLPIADGGCSEVTYLVLTGPLRGTVWSGGELGWLPYADEDGTFLGFDAWYRKIADEPKAPKKKKATKPKTTEKTITVDRAASQLNVRRHGLTKLPDEVAEMTKLTMVYLGDNALTSLPRPLLSVAHQLVALELGPNPIDRLDEDDVGCFSRLTHLDVKGTKIVRLPEALVRLPLWKLELDQNPQLDFEQAADVLARIPTLRWLSMSGCALSEVPSGIVALPQLERLYLADNALTALPAKLASKLELLGVMDNQIETIPDSLEPCVQNLYFRGNPGARREKKRFDAIRRNFVAL